MSRGKTAAMKRASTMRSTAAPGLYIVAVVLWLSCHDNTIASVSQWLHIGEVDNDVIVLWVSAGQPSRQKRGDTMFQVEGGNGYLYLRMGL